MELLQSEGRVEFAVWKNIKRGWDLVSSKVSFKVRNVRRVKFWKDEWCEDESILV